MTEKVSEKSPGSRYEFENNPPVEDKIFTTEVMGYDGKKAGEHGDWHDKQSWDAKECSTVILEARESRRSAPVFVVWHATPIPTLLHSKNPNELFDYDRPKAMSVNQVMADELLRLQIKGIVGHHTEALSKLKAKNPDYASEYREGLVKSLGRAEKFDHRKVEMMPPDEIISGMVEHIKNKCGSDCKIKATIIPGGEAMTGPYTKDHLGRLAIKEIHEILKSRRDISNIRRKGGAFRVGITARGKKHRDTKPRVNPR